jgi:hypothetical protein
MTNMLPSSNVNVPNPYQLQGQQAADRGAIQGTENLGKYNLGGQYLPEYMSLTNAGVNNPYAGGYQQGGQQAGQMGMQGGQQAYGAGGQLMNQGLGMLPDVSALLSMGFDPQQAYYGRQAQRTMDQQNAVNAMSGVGGTPYGAGVTGNTMSNFNIDWQNSALQRALAGAQGAGGLYGNIGQGVGQGAGLQAGGIQEYLQGAATPYNVFSGINANQLGLLGQAGQYGNMAAQIPQMQIQDYMSYLNQANQNAQTGISAQRLGLDKAKLQDQEYAAIGQGVGQAAGWGFGGGFGQMGNAFGGNPFAGFFGGGNPAYQGANMTGVMQ